MNRQTDRQTVETNSGCRMSDSDLSSEILSEAYALNPFTLYNSSFFFSSSADNITAEPCSPGPTWNTQKYRIYDTRHSHMYHRQYQYSNTFPLGGPYIQQWLAIATVHYSKETFRSVQYERRAISFEPKNVRLQFFYTIYTSVKRSDFTDSYESAVDMTSS